MLEHDLIASDLGAIFIHNSDHDSTSIDFFLYQNLYNDNIIQLEKLDITGNVSDHYPLFFTRAKELYKRRVPKIVLLLVRLDGIKSIKENMRTMLRAIWKI